MKSLFKSWKLKASSKVSSPRRDTELNDTTVVPESPRWPSESPTASKSSSSSASPEFQTPVLQLDVSPASSKDTFVSSAEDVIQAHKAQGYRSPGSERRHTQNSYPSHRSHNDAPRMAVSDFSIRHGAPPNVGHGPPRNARHGPPNILQAQLSSINANKGHAGHAGARQSFHVPPPLSPRCQDPLIARQRTRTPTLVKFDPSVEVIAPRASRASLASDGMFTADQASLQRKDPSNGHTSRLLECPPSKERSPSCEASPGVTSSISMERTTSTPSRGLKLYHSSQSSPHLPSKPERHVTSENDLASMFPSPPPLKIRKKVPRPLVLQPRSPSATVLAFPPSPNFDSADSTPVATPTSARLAPSTTPTQSPLGKTSFSRLGSAIPPLRYDAPTSPLPSPPVTGNPQGKTPDSRQPSYSFNSRPHLRGSMSTYSLRGKSHGHPSLPTHRMTSSDPAEALIQNTTRTNTLPRPSTKDNTGADTRCDRSSHGSSSNDPHVQWGYAF